jgi:hypothetical protein
MDTITNNYASHAFAKEKGYKKNENLYNASYAL